MLHIAIYSMIYLGSLLMVFNIYGFVRYVRRVGKMKNWEGGRHILTVPIVLLVAFLLGYLGVGIFGAPDLLISAILFFGSVFVFVMYRLISSITDRIQAGEQVEARLLAAEEADRMKTAFLASMSHEMRTPMNVILGVTSLALKEPELTPRTRQQFEKVDQSAQHLLGLINHILDLNDIGSGELSLRSEAFYPADMLAQVSGIARTLCEDKGLSYRCELPDALPACCAGDETQLRNLLLGLLDNAVKYTDAPGSVRLSAHCTPEGEGVKLRFEVADSGVGMSEGFLSRVFQPFTQEDASSTSRYGGGGLSLAVSKKLADLMGGVLEAQSEKGKGSVFTLTLTLPVLESAPEKPAAPETEVSLSGRRILVVEDMMENAEIVQDLLELEDVVSDHAVNGQAALKKFESSPPGTYDAILMDLRMPVMDGLEAARRIRALPRADAQSVPIIALTANAFQSDVDATQAAGMNAHLAKPADANELYATIKKTIALSQTTKGGNGHD